MIAINDINSQTDNADSVQFHAENFFYSRKTDFVAQLKIYTPCGYSRIMQIRDDEFLELETQARDYSEITAAKQVLILQKLRATEHISDESLPGLK